MFKLYNWKYSILLRCRVEIGLSIIVIIFFQYYIKELNTYLHLGMDLLEKLMKKDIAFMEKYERNPDPLLKE